MHLSRFTKSSNNNSFQNVQHRIIVQKQWNHHVILLHQFVGAYILDNLLILVQCNMYSKLGYKAYGDEFIDAGIRHRHMKKNKPSYIIG